MNKQDFTSYQYSVIRYHHDLSTGEFLNIGIAIYAPELNYFKAQITSKYSRITDTFCTANGEEYRYYINRLMRRFENKNHDLSSTQDALFNKESTDLEKILREYLRKESSFQYSNPSSGISKSSIDSIDKAFNNLYDKYVEKYIKKQDNRTRNEDQIWKDVYLPRIEEVQKNLVYSLVHTVVKTDYDDISYDYAWKNGKWHLIQPISFDLIKPGSITEKAQRFLGKNVLLNTSEEVKALYILLGQPQNKEKEIVKSYNKAKDIITANDFNYELEVIEEDGAKDFASYLSTTITK